MGNEESTLSLSHTLSLQMPRESLEGNSDIVVRWLALRCAGTNPSILSKVLPFIGSNVSTWSLSDGELAILVPALLTKVTFISSTHSTNRSHSQISDMKDVIRSESKSSLVSLIHSFSLSRLVPFFSESLKSKSIR